MSVIVGLTGGIATGKSTVVGFFKDAGIPVIETDIIAKNLMQKGSKVYQAVVAYFGEEILLSNHEINRQTLGHIIFRDAHQRQALNDIVHPAVKTVMLNDIKKYQAEGKKLIVVDVPLLFEAGFDHYVDVTLLVITDPATQRQRLIDRDQIDPATALRKIKAQWPLARKKEKADYLLDNSHSILTSKKAFLDILNQLKERAQWDS